MENSWEVETPQSKKLGLSAFRTSRERKCEVCGFSDVISIHYIIPLEAGGAHRDENVVVLCLNHEFLAKTKKDFSFSRPGARREGVFVGQADPKKKEEAIKACCRIMFSGMMETLFTEKHYLRDVGELEPKEQQDIAEYRRLMTMHGLQQEDLINYILRQSPEKLAELTGGFPMDKK